MGVRAVLSKVCFYALVAYYAVQGLLRMEGSFLMEKIWNTENNGLEYFGDEMAVQYILFLFRVGGLIQLLISLSALTMGDTKMCFSLLAMCTYGELASFSRDISAAFTLAKFNEVHKESGSVKRFILFGALIVNYIGLICASGKQKDEKLVRSKSGFVNHVLILSMFLEVAVWGYTLVDSIGHFIQIQPTMDMKMFEKSFTTEGEWQLAILIGLFVANICTLAAFVVTLKPTSMALILSMLFHGVTSVFLLLFKQNCEKVVMDSASLQNVQSFAIQGGITHLVFAALLFVSLIVDERTKDKAKAD